MLSVRLGVQVQIKLWRGGWKSTWPVRCATFSDCPTMQPDADLPNIGGVGFTYFRVAPGMMACIFFVDFAPFLPRPGLFLLLGSNRSRIDFYPNREVVNPI